MGISLAPTRARKWIPVLLPFAVAVAGGMVYASLSAYSDSWGPVLGGLYFIPITMAAIVLGGRAAVAVALASGVAHAVATTIAAGGSWIAPAAQTVLFLCVALTANKLAQSRSARSRPPSGETVSDAPSGFQNLNNGSEVWLSRAVLGLVRQFRTPVTSIEGAGWVLDDPQLPDEKRRELIGIVRKEAHRLNRALADVLDFTQPRRPRFRMIDLPALINDVVDLASPKGHGRAYVFRKDVAENMPRLRGDPEQMRQVLLHLVMNSVQSMPVGGQIEISATFEDNQFLITVADHGRGIAPSDVGRIFEPFFTTNEHSLGLGLPLVLRIVSEHGGRVDVDAQRPEGTRICVILPSTQDTSPVVK
jgi:signal transduction histidine kinase